MKILTVIFILNKELIHCEHVINRIGIKLFRKLPSMINNCDEATLENPSSVYYWTKLFIKLKYYNCVVLKIYENIF